MPIRYSQDGAGVPEHGAQEQMTVEIEISPDRLAAYESQARSEGLNLGQWMKKLADERTSSDAPSGVSGATFVEACSRIRGLADDLDFPRNPSSARPLDL